MAAASFALFDAVILKGTFIGWILRSPSRIPGFLPISSKWVFVLFGLGAIQYARHPEGLLEYSKRRSAARAADRHAASAAELAAGRCGRAGDGGAGRMSAVLKVEGITKKFGRIVALQDAGLTIEAGERVGLIGPNGAGKTTFFNCMLGVLRTDAGRVELDGEDISGLPVHERARRGIGRTFQRIELFPESTVRDHLFVAERVHGRKGRLWKDLVGLGRPRAEEVARCDEVLAAAAARAPRRRSRSSD